MTVACLAPRPLSCVRVLKTRDSRLPPFTPRSAPPLRQIQSLPRRPPSMRALARRITIGLFGRRRSHCRRRSICCPDVWLRRISYCQKEFRKSPHLHPARRRSILRLPDGRFSRRSDADLAHGWANLRLGAGACCAGCAGVRSAAENVGIVVRDPARSSPTTRIVARNGRIVVEEEENGGGHRTGRSRDCYEEIRRELDAGRRCAWCGRVVARMDLAA
ncbi:hypothetical protein AXF42_Ash020462 [Apostasia shenzhenica]|uniref:Uncharacterized protein n=1 Tax=Apostasia shenzhenica TaxID=1088818 RepID=A0A2H9ZYI4_9ASPA|nr:hypothetical protein AXF42_Ash020462 [Apostasia shenzhenica]